MVLVRDVQGLQTEEEMEAYLNRMRESLSSVHLMLQHTAAPNMKALERMREVRDKFQGVAEGTCSFILSTTWLINNGRRPESATVQFNNFLL